MGEIYVDLRAAREPAVPELIDTPVPVLVYDLVERTIRYGNPALGELVDRPVEDLIGTAVDDLIQPVEALLPSDDPEALAAGLLSGESAVVRPDGTRRHVEARTAPIDYDGMACGQAVLWDITERIRWEQQLLHRASHDTLTGLPNAWYASIYLHRALGKAPGKTPQHVAVFFVDLDGFKQINDTYGHHAGDSVLRQTAKRLKTAASAADLTARLHGDEFLVVCRVANAIHAAHLAQRIRRALARPIQVGSQTLGVTASVGIAVSTPNSADADRLLRFADHRMYTDKKHSAPPGRRREQVGAPEPVVARGTAAVTGAGPAEARPGDPV